MNRTPTTAGAARTRARILATALDLFNRFGTADVTTNQIAAEAGISPGNLYYWFTDKQAIIRELFAGLSDANLALWSDAENLPEGPDGLLARLAVATVLTRRYRFFSRDLLALVHADPVLRAAYVANRGRRVASFRTLAQRWRETGVVGPVSDERLDDLV